MSGTNNKAAASAAAKATVKTVEIVAIADFTVHDGKTPNGTLVKAGTAFEVAETDVGKWRTRARPRATEAEVEAAREGATITRS